MWKVVYYGVLSTIVLICVILNTYSLLKNIDNESSVTVGRVMYNVFCILFTSAAFIFDMHNFVKEIVKLMIA